MTAMPKIPVIMPGYNVGRTPESVRRITSTLSSHVPSRRIFPNITVAHGRNDPRNR